MENNIDLVEVIFGQATFEDSSHLQLLYNAFLEAGKEVGDISINEDTSGIDEALNELDRILKMKRTFRWITISPKILKRFHKSKELSYLLRERGNKSLHSTLKTETESLSEALRGYNLAILFAPGGSTELALAYEKRAELFLRLGDPSQAQSDIKAAASNTSYPTKAAHKLIDLQNRCTALAHAKSRLGSFDEQKSYLSSTKSLEVVRRYVQTKFFHLNAKNPNVSNTADCVRIDYQPQCGRRLVVTRNVKPGEVLLIDEPYAMVLQNMLNWDVEHCTNCSKPISSGIPCNSCTFGWFCSQACLKEANRGIHKYEHNYLSYLKSSPLITVKGLLACRILFKVGPDELYRIFKSRDPLYFSENVLQSDIDNPNLEQPKGFNQSGTYSSTSYLPIYHLISHPYNQNPLKAKSNTFKSLILLNLIKDCSDFFTRYEYNEDVVEFQDFIASLLLRHMESIEYNAITLSQLDPSRNGETVRYGAGVYPVLCLINHSCDPNCVPIRSLKYLKTGVIAMKSLVPGEEITFSYSPHFSQVDLQERRTFLMDKYRFLCICEACDNLWGPLSGTMTVPESQCNSCGRYILAGQCPKCVLKDLVIKESRASLGLDIAMLRNLIRDNSESKKSLESLVEAMERIKPLLEFCCEHFPSNYTPFLEFQDIFKIIIVRLVSL